MLYWFTVYAGVLSIIVIVQCVEFQELRQNISSVLLRITLLFCRLAIHIAHGAPNNNIVDHIGRLVIYDIFTSMQKS